MVVSFIVFDAGVDVLLAWPREGQTDLYSICSKMKSAKSSVRVVVMRPTSILATMRPSVLTGHDPLERGLPAFSSQS